MFICNYFHLKMEISHKNVIKILMTLRACCFNICLEILFALILKPAEKSTFIIIIMTIIVHSFHQQTGLDALLLVTQIPRENGLPVAQESPE